MAKCVNTQSPRSRSMRTAQRGPLPLVQPRRRAAVRVILARFARVRARRCSSASRVLRPTASVARTKSSRTTRMTTRMSVSESPPTTATDLAHLLALRPDSPTVRQPVATRPEAVCARAATSPVPRPAARRTRSTRPTRTKGRSFSQATHRPVTRVPNTVARLPAAGRMPPRLHRAGSSVPSRK